MGELYRCWSLDNPEAYFAVCGFKKADAVQTIANDGVFDTLVCEFDWRWHDEANRTIKIIEKKQEISLRLK